MRNIIQGLREGTIVSDCLQPVDRREIAVMERVFLHAKMNTPPWRGCAAKGCRRAHHARGMCEAHYKQGAHLK